MMENQNSLLNPSRPSKLSRVKEYFENPETYLRGNYYLAVRAAIVREMLGEVSDSQIIDLGCGDGSISIQFLSKRTKVTFVDLSKSMLERTRSKIPRDYEANATLINANVLRFETPLLYDIAICIGVLAHVENVDELIEKLASILRPGGRCILQLTDYNKVLGKYSRFNLALHGVFSKSGNGYSLNRTGLEEIISTAKRNGLVIHGSRRHSLMLPFMVRLPKEMLYRYDLRISKSRLLSSCGKEAIVLFRKET